MIDWINSEIVLKFMNWIENIFSFFKNKTSNKHEKISKSKLKEKMDEARIASVEGDEDKINKIVEDIHKSELINEKIKRS